MKLEGKDKVCYDNDDEDTLHVLLIVQSIVSLQDHTGRNVQHSQPVVPRMHQESGFKGM